MIQLILNYINNINKIIILFKKIRHFKIIISNNSKIIINLKIKVFQVIIIRIFIIFVKILMFLIKNSNFKQNLFKIIIKFKTLIMINSSNLRLIISKTII